MTIDTKEGRDPIQVERMSDGRGKVTIDGLYTIATLTDSGVEIKDGERWFTDRQLAAIRNFLIKYRG